MMALPIWRGYQRVIIRSEHRLARGSEPQDSGLRQLLASVSFFRGVDDAALDEIRVLAHLKRVSKGEFFFHQGEAAEHLHVLLEGEVQLVQISPEGQNVPLHFVHPGQPFGGGVVLGHRVYPAAAEAILPSLALRWDGGAINHLLDRHPKLVRNMLHVVAERFAELQDRFRELATQRVEQRVARALLRLAQQYGKATDRGVRIELPLSRQDLAELTGTTLSTVSRIISRWESEGLLESGRGWILLHRSETLVRMAEEGDATERSASPRTGMF